MDLKVRELDGLFIRTLTSTGWQNRCLTDCTKEEVNVWLKTKSPTQVKEALLHLHHCLRYLGDTLDITRTTSEATEKEKFDA